MALNAKSKKSGNFDDKDDQGNLVVSSDDLLPALVFLVLKSTFITDWVTNLAFMSDFHFSKASGDELGYCLASFEAATVFIRNGSLRQLSIDSYLPIGKIDQDLAIGKLLMDDPPSTALSAEETASLKAYMISLVQSGDETALTEFFKQQELLRELEKASSGCHPLCECPKCTGPGENEENAQKRLPFTINSDLGRGTTVLHMAALLDKASVLNALCKMGGDPDILDEDGLTPLHVACLAGNQSIALLLLGNGARADISDLKGNKPIHAATYYGSLHCVKALLYYDQNVRNSMTKVNSQNHAGDTALHLAIFYQHAEIVSCLLECEALVKVRNRQGRNPPELCRNALIHRLLLREDPTVDFVLVEKKTAADEMSILSGEDYQSAPSHHSLGSSHGSPTPGDPGPSLEGRQRNISDGERLRRIDHFLRAVKDNDLPMVNHLVRRPPKIKEDGANPDLNEDELCHPLCQCPKCKEIHQKFEELVEVNAVGSEGQSGLQLAAGLGHLDLVRALVKLGADLTLAHPPNQQLPVHFAAKYGQSEVLEILWCSGAELERMDLNGDTPLHLAAGRGMTAAVETLCTLKANIHRQNAMGDTALHLAVKWDRKSVVEALLRHGASPMAMNNMRLTPMDLARRSETRKLLEKYWNNVVESP